MNKKIILSVISYLYLFYFLILLLSNGSTSVLSIIIENPLRLFTVYTEPILSYSSHNQIGNIDFFLQKKYLVNGIRGQSIIQILLPIIITYLSFYTKLNVLNKEFKKNYLLWVYILTFLLSFLMFIHFTFNS